MSSERCPSVLSRRVVYRTPWFDLLAKEVAGFDEPYFALAAPDCVTIVPVTGQRTVLFIRQYRPALETFTFELPSGHLEPGETPSDGALRELREETGYDGIELTPLGTLSPDTGRMGNQVWTFVATVREVAIPEPGVELHPRPFAEVGSMIRNGQLRHALDVAALAQAALGGHLSLFP